jgi:hypothetical protein
MSKLLIQELIGLNMFEVDEPAANLIQMQF